MLADTLLIFDRIKHTIKVVSNVHVKSKSQAGKAYNEAAKKIDAIIKKLRTPIKKLMPQLEQLHTPVNHEGGSKLKIKSNMTKPAFAIVFLR